ncbi:MAG: hypothetical protein J0H74_10035 [Chitinophagaceae bacterium]|nr:hypothetical protein [Chitinophagaceae bacterium]
MPLANQLYCLFLLLCCLLPPATRAQSDSLPDHLALNNAIRQYHTYLTPEPGLYRGSQYVIYSFQLKEGHPYFDEDHMQTGSVLYNGILYKDVPLIYDLVKDALVTNDAGKIYKIALINQEIDSFTIQNHIFIKLKDSLTPTVPRPGFYQLLYDGRSTILKKEKKTIREEVSTGAIVRSIDYSVTYYLKKENTWYTINNKKGLMRAFRNKSPELRKFLRAGDIKFQDDKDNTLLKTAAWYDSLHQ